MFHTADKQEWKNPAIEYDNFSYLQQNRETCDVKYTKNEEKIEKQFTLTD